MTSCFLPLECFNNCTAGQRYVCMLLLLIYLYALFVPRCVCPSHSPSSFQPSCLPLEDSDLASWSNWFMERCFIFRPSELRGTHSLSSPWQSWRVKKTFQICTDRRFFFFWCNYYRWWPCLWFCFWVLISAKWNSTEMRLPTLNFDRIMQITSR